MASGSAGTSRWTRRFVLAGAVGLVAAQAGAVAGTDPRPVAVAVVFGFVCPTAFGMAYLLVPSVAGRTLVDRRLAGVHFPLAVGGAALVVGAAVGDPPPALVGVGPALWAAGVAVFVGAQAATVGPALREDPAAVLEPLRSTRAANAAIPVAVGYLVVGAVALLRSTPLPRVVHYHAAGFAALLVFALGARLLVGFFHAAAPRALTWVALAAGAVGPALLGGYLYVAPWFRVGAAIEAAAMLAYAGMVAAVAVRTDRRRVGLYGIALGALAGALAVGVAVHYAFAVGGVRIAAHATLVAAGFFPLTVAGYAYQFFPVTSGDRLGASERGALATLALLAAGAGVQAVGVQAGVEAVRAAGAAVSLAGALGYAALLAGRFLG